MNKQASQIAKGLAVIMLLYCHLFVSEKRVQLGGPQGIDFFPLGQENAIQLAVAMKLSVAVFVFITAFGTSRQVSSRLLDAEGLADKMSEHVLRRWIRLLTSFWVVYVIAVIVSMLLGTNTPEQVYFTQGTAKGIMYMAVDFLGLATVFGSPTLNGTWWYMPVAYCLIALIPVLSMAVRKIGSLPIAALLVFVPILSGWSMKSNFWWWMPTVGVALFIADHNCFERWEARFFGECTDDGRKVLARACVQFGTCALAIACLIVFRQKTEDYYWLFDCLEAPLVCLQAQAIVHIGGRGLGFLGRHSMNIFMLHTFICSKFFLKQIYALHYWYVMLAVLLVASLCCSIAIEQLKAWLHFGEKERRLENRLCGILSR